MKSTPPLTASLIYRTETGITYDSSACSWLEQTLTVRTPWSRLDQEVGVLVRASCWSVDCRLAFTFSSYASSAVCAMGTLGTSPYGIIDALDPLEYYWPGTAPLNPSDLTSSVSNLTLHPFGDFADSSTRYSCTPCNTSLPLTAYVASSERDGCMSECLPGSKSANPSLQGLGSHDQPCARCEVGKYSESAAQLTCNPCAATYVTPDKGASSRDWCYHAELIVERIWRMGQDIAVQVQWEIYPKTHARVDDMISIHSGNAPGEHGRRQLAWAYTSSDSANQEHHVPGPEPSPIGSHTLFFESAGIQFYHVRYSSMTWNTTYRMVLFESKSFRLDDDWLTSGSCLDNPEDSELCIPDDTGQQILDDGILCANGAVARAWDFTKCPPCPRGEAGNKVCAKCPRGFFADEEGLKECKECPSTGERATSFATLSDGTGTDCFGVEGCCVPCSQATGLPVAPQCVETDNTAVIEVEATTAPPTTPPPTSAILESKETTTSAAARETSTARVTTTTPPPQERECGNGARKVPDAACWTDAFGGLLAKIENSKILPCPALPEGFFESPWTQTGDGRYHPAEECDDGDEFNGDGCSNMCTIELHWDCGIKEVVYDGSKPEEACFSSRPNSMITLDRLSRGPAASGKEDLDWFTQLAQVEGILQVIDYKLPPGAEPRASGWAQMYLAAGHSKHNRGGIPTGPDTPEFGLWERLDTLRLPGLFKAAEQGCAAVRNTHATVALNPFSSACSGGDGVLMSQWQGRIAVPGRDRSRSHVCEWKIVPYLAGSLRVSLRFNLRRNKDRVEIWDTGAYSLNGDAGCRVRLSEFPKTSVRCQNIPH